MKKENEGLVTAQGENKAEVPHGHPLPSSPADQWAHERSHLQQDLNNLRNQYAALVGKQDAIAKALQATMEKINELQGTINGGDFAVRLFQQKK